MKYIKKIGAMLLFILLLSGCSWLYQTEQSTKSVVDMTEANLKVADLKFVNQFGEASSTADLQGQVWIVDTIFTRCPSVCGIMTPNMMLLQEAIIEENLDVKLYSFSVDPEFDSPEILKKYGEGYGANFDYWTFVTGYSSEQIKQFVQQSFKQIVEPSPESDDIIHPTSFFLIDEQGNVVRKYDGLTSDIEPIIKDLKKYMKKK